MFDKLDGPAVKAVLAAEQESRRLGHAFVDTEQLLLGLLADGNNSATRVMSQLGLGHQQIRKRMIEIIGRGDSVVGVETPFTPRMKQLLECAWSGAQQRGSSSICIDDLLGAFCTVNDGVAGQILSEAGITSEKLQEGINKNS